MSGIEIDNAVGSNKNISFNNEDTSWAIEALMAIGGGRKQQSPTTTKALANTYEKESSIKKRDTSSIENDLEVPPCKKQDIKMIEDQRSTSNNSPPNRDTTNECTIKNDEIEEERQPPSSSPSPTSTTSASTNNNKKENVNEIKATKLIIEKMNIEIEVLKSAIKEHKSIDPEGKLPLLLPKKEEETNDDNPNHSSGSATGTDSGTETDVGNSTKDTDSSSITAPQQSNNTARDKIKMMMHGSTKTSRNNSRGSYRCKLCGSFKKQHICQGSNEFFYYNNANIQTDCTSRVPFKERDSKVSMNSGRVITVSASPWNEYANH